MERLTNTAWRNFDPWECCGQDNFCTRGCHEKGGCNNGCIVPKLYGRLAAYEDTGLEPEEIYEVRFLIAAQRDPQKLARLRELVLADQNGQLVVLPCKVGDTVWVVWGKEVVEAKVCCIRPFMFADRAEVRGNALWTFEDPFYDDGRPLTQEIFIIFGKDAFLTREEAEAALAGKGISE